MNISEQIRSPFNSRYPHEGKKKNWIKVGELEVRKGRDTSKILK